MPNKVTSKLKEIAESVLSTTDFFLVDVEIKGGDIPEVWVSIDGEERGVNMDECAEISNEMSFLLDAHDIFSDKYRINVSSPGLSRPLVDKRQYPKNKGRKAKIAFTDEGENHEVEGVLQEVFEDKIVIEMEEESRSITFDKLLETTIIPSFK